MTRLFISFSGGRTSAMMTQRLLETRSSDQQIVVLFANTGLENEETLRFVDQCDRKLGFIVGMAMLEPFEPFVDLHPRNDPELDVGSACGESCEIYADETDLA
jgi:3'-phosphoadenosine 5'-phosphosulfate sulfotransferase (PAPS reductase)/FAD synthetase